MLINWTSPCRGVWCTCFLLANSEDPDQTPRSVESDLGLHCLPMSKKWEAMLIWVKLFRKHVSMSRITLHSCLCQFD